MPSIITGNQENGIYRSCDVANVMFKNKVVLITAHDHKVYHDGHSNENVKNQQHTFKKSPNSWQIDGNTVFRKHVCGRHGLWPSWFVAVMVCGRYGLWPSWFVAVILLSNPILSSEGSGRKLVKIVSHK